MPKLNRIYITNMLLGMALAFAGCEQMDTHSTPRYNADSLLQAQAKRLQQAHASVFKKVTFENTADEVNIIQADSAFWQSAFESFSILGALNKPGSRHDYEAALNRPVTNANLLVNQYKATGAQRLRSVNIFHQGTPGSIRKITAVTEAENLLYKNHRTLTLDFQIIKDVPLLTHYEIEGWQQLIFGQKKYYSIKADIIF